jgi:dienelactone hydrolase
MKRTLLPLLVLVLAVTAGCPYVPPETHHPHVEKAEPITNTKYELYVPTNYEQLGECPLVITLHGTNGYDDREKQILEWRDTAEKNGLIVAAPQMRSTQGPVPMIPSVNYASEKDLLADERAILAVIDHVSGMYHVNQRHILLTGFSSGGFPLIWTGLRNPLRFDMIIARDCNYDMNMLKKIDYTVDVRQMPILILWGRDESVIPAQSWAAFALLREKKCLNTKREEVPGGHIRRPDIAYKAWAPRLGKAVPKPETKPEAKKKKKKKTTPEVERGTGVKDDWGAENGPGNSTTTKPAGGAVGP